MDDRLFLFLPSTSCFSIRPDPAAYNTVGPVTTHKETEKGLLPCQLP